MCVIWALVWGKGGIKRSKYVVLAGIQYIYRWRGLCWLWATQVWDKRKDFGTQVKLTVVRVLYISRVK